MLQSQQLLLSFQKIRGSGEKKPTSYGHMTFPSSIKYKLIITFTWSLTCTRSASASNIDSEIINTGKYQCFRELIMSQISEF